MTTLAEYRAAIKAAAAEGNVNRLLHLDVQMRRVCWSPQAKAEAHELQDLALAEAKRCSDEPHMIARLPRWESYTESAGKVQRAIP